MSEQYYRLLKEGEVIQKGDRQFANASSTHDVRDRWAGHIYLRKDFVGRFLRPITLPIVGWLPIGDKKEFEEGTLFTCFKHGVGEDRDLSRDTHGS